MRDSSLQSRGHAAILGSGIAGLAAAGALAPRFDRVTLYERDPAPQPEPRKGIPQGHHAHILLKSGEIALNALFPGLSEELAARGSHPVNFGLELPWSHHGFWRVRYDSADLVILMQSRPFLESVVRERLAGLGNVAFRYETAAAGIEVEKGEGKNGRATGVRIRAASSEEETIEPMDLIVDATGRGSQLPRFLAALGYGTPREDRVPIDLVYASRIYRIPPAQIPARIPERAWKALLIYPIPPIDANAGLIFPLEGDRWMVTLVGYRDGAPPSDEAGWLDFARRLPEPTLYEAIRDAEPLSEIRTFHFPYARWTRYEKLDRFPAGLLPIGDSVCSFDPVYGQGMSASALEARALGDYLDRDRQAADPRPFLRAQARIVAAPWLLATSEDFRYPHLAGQRPFWMPLLQLYTGRVFRLATTRPADYDRLLRVLHLVDRPARLFHPATMLRVAATAFTAPPASRPERPG
jgi:2-polyprenyl-6-methoxyphenol hydroxylase-like FAD-dependent oxidoreductase